ncbi:MAG TPA: hypothetical protein PK668_16760 [Myxococcota bacterium]|nr:hypothetical protein [Myxococcota bacterium]HRY94810.1 hypothetical protein [Myxococcota bacterium]HSA22304.1 hypothetical protein [Myxococcota bacterium]
MSPRNPSFGPSRPPRPSSEVLRSFYVHCDELVEQEFTDALEGELQAALLALTQGRDDGWSW